MRPIVTILAVLLSFVARTALADTGAVIVSANSRIAERDRTLALNAAAERLRAAGWELTNKPLTAKEIEAVTTCLHNVEAWPCVSKIVASRGVRRVAAVALRRDQTIHGMPELVITGRLVLADVELVVLVKRFCQQCTDDTLTALTTELTAELLQQGALESGRTVLSIKSTPQGSIYTVDGDLTSATDAIITVVPGRHVVTIERDGYQTETRTIEAVEGKTAEVMVTLRRLEPIEKLRDPDSVEKHGAAHRSRLLPITLVVGGSVAVAGGLVALGFNERQITKPRDVDQPRWHYNTVPIGVTSIIGGAALGGFGAYLWWRYSRDDARTASSTPVVTPVAGGAVIGLHRAF
jgi:PEGA domain